MHVVFRRTPFPVSIHFRATIDPPVKRHQVKRRFAGGSVYGWRFTGEPIVIRDGMLTW